ncbi:MAG: hypothetical protein WAK20_18240 [Candidatus Acidiferrum sp.]
MALDHDSARAEPYPIDIIRFELKMRSGGEGAIHGFSAKQLHRLGDAASIGIIKLLDKQNLVDPDTVRSFLPIIKAAFTHLDLIPREMDRHPSITALLLDYLRHNVPDIELQNDIQQVESFIRMKTERTGT